MVNKEQRIEAIKEEIILMQQKLSSKEKKEFGSSKCILYSGGVDSKTVVIGRDLGCVELKSNVPLMDKAGTFFRFIESTMKVSSFITVTIPFKAESYKGFSQELRIKFSPYIKEIIRTINPKSVILLGNEALSLMTDNCSGIMSWAQNDSVYWQVGDKSYNTFPVIHPSYLIMKHVTYQSLKSNHHHKKLFKELFFRNFLKAHQFAGNVK